MTTILMSLLAGVAGMGLGGLITAVFGSKTDKMISIFLSFAGGVMVSIVFFELLPEAVVHSNVWIAIFGLAMGALLVLGLNHIMDRISRPGNGHSKLHDTFAEFFHASDMIESKKSMLRAGMIMLFAIALHNIPEGLAMGAAGYHDIGLGIAIAIIIALHNIPEGMAVAAPLMAGGLTKTKSVVITLVAGATTTFGAIAGVLIGGISSLALAFSFAMAGGAMLYVVVGEILPQAIVASKSRVPTVFALIGIVAGMLFIEIFA
jgi:ZIP family zinc transporter